MYKVVISHPEQGQKSISLETEQRSLCRSLTILCTENDIECQTTVEQKAKVVKFEGITPEPEKEPETKLKPHTTKPI